MEARGSGAAAAAIVQDDAAPDALSVVAAFAGRSVLITGATGYVGSLVLEALLRVCPDVDRVFILVREKRGRCPQERRQRLLDSGLFHLLWDRPGVLDKVEEVEGDILQPRCGLCSDDLRQLNGVGVIVHAAASVCFMSPVRESLQHNYHATAEVLSVAAALPQLCAFVHVSTAFVNGHQPKGTRVDEQLYPVFDEAGQPIQHTQFVQRLESVPPGQASALAAALQFPNPYCLSKWLAERLVAETCAAGLPAASVRPSIIGAVAGTPYPGYVGNRTGTTGAALAIGTGIWTFSRHNPRSVMDIVPGDTVASAILLAAAALIQDSRQRVPRLLVLHVGTSASSVPLLTGRFYQEVRSHFSEQPAPMTFSATRGMPKQIPIVRSGAIAALLEALASLKFWAVAAALRLSGRAALARKLLGAWTAVKTFNRPRLDFDLRFDTSRVAALAARLPPSERDSVRPLWDPRAYAAEAQRRRHGKTPQGVVAAGAAPEDGVSGAAAEDGSWVDLGGAAAAMPSAPAADHSGLPEASPTTAAAAEAAPLTRDSSMGSSLNPAAGDGSSSGVDPASVSSGREGWRRYLRLYLAGASALCLRQPPTAESAADTGFRLIPPRERGR